MQPPQTPVPTQIPTGQVDPRMLAILKARAQASGQPAGPAPNSMQVPGAAPPPPNVAAGPMGPRPTATPNQQVMKAATQAQSPMQDPQTRASAKDLILRLMKHM